MKKIKYLILVLTILCVTVQSSGCWIFNLKFPIINGPDMGERVYQRIEEAEVDNAISELFVLIETKGNRDLIIEKRNDLFMDYYYKALTMNTIASINYDKNVNDEYWQQESVYAYNLATKLQNSVLEIEKALLTSPTYGDYFKSQLGEEYTNTVLNSQTDNSEQLAILERISDLEGKYSALYSENKTSELATLYIDLINARNEYAKTKLNDNGQNYSNYMDYAYAEVYGREYTPYQTDVFRGAIKEHVAPLRDLVYTNLPSLEKTDAELTKNQILKYVPEIIEQTAPDMLDNWDYMIKRNLYDFDISETKANTSYVTYFYEYNDAYMFINPSGYFTSDISTILHEFGHYNENFMANPNLTDDNLMSYDLAETHSQGFELVTLPAVNTLINDRYTSSALYKTYASNLIFNSIWSMLSNCIFDEFEYTVYTADQTLLTPAYLEETFNSIWQEYWPISSNYKYYDIPHLYLSPAYCISYSVSMVFASEIWASENPVEKYLSVVSYGTGNLLSNVATSVELGYPLDVKSVITVKNAYATYINDTFGWTLY